MPNKRRTAEIILLITVGCILNSFTEVAISPNFAVKSVIKIFCFFALPIIYSLFHKDIRISALFDTRKKSIISSIFMGVIVYGSILLVYFLLRPFFDLSNIPTVLKGSLGINEHNFMFITIYISLFNSLLEEFFFRGFAFLLLKQQAGGKFAYLFSSGMFALYHIAIMLNWFSAFLFILLIACLFATGLFFDFLDERNSDIYSSWVIHLSANLAINTVGFILFGII